MRKKTELSFLFGGFSALTMLSSQEAASAVAASAVAQKKVSNTRVAMRCVALRYEMLEKAHYSAPTLAVNS